MLKAGDYVVHSMEGVCEVKSIVEMPKGRERVSYYQLSSWPDGKTTVYVPVKQDPDRGARLRKLLSSEEMQQVFKGILHDEQEWISDIGARQEWMLSIMKEGDPYKMARMTRMLMKKDLEKPLGSRDKATLLTAQKVLFSEIAIVTKKDYRTVLANIKQSLRSPEGDPQLI